MLRKEAAWSRANSFLSADQEKIEAAAKELNDKIMPIGAKMYEAASKEESKDDKKSDDKKSDDDAVEGQVVDK